MSIQTFTDIYTAVYTHHIYLGSHENCIQYIIQIWICIIYIYMYCDHCDCPKHTHEDVEKHTELLVAEMQQCLVQTLINYW